MCSPPVADVKGQRVGHIGQEVAFDEPTQVAFEVDPSLLLDCFLPCGLLD
jgi:hypothetical protein